MSMRKGQLPKTRLGTRRQCENDAAAVVAIHDLVDKAGAFQSGDEFSRCIWCDEQLFGKVTDCGLGAGRTTFYRQERLMLMSCETSFMRRNGTEVGEVP